MPKITDLDISRTEVGQIVFHGSSTPPRHTVICDGSAVSRSVYSKLFNKIGTQFGDGTKNPDGSSTGFNGTHFNLPDLRSRTPMGAGLGPSLTNRQLNDKPGKETHALSHAEMPAHNHPAYAANTGTGHNHTYHGPHHVGQLRNDGGGMWTSYYTANTSTDGYHWHTVYTDDRGSGTPHENMAPTLVGLFVIVYL